MYPSNHICLSILTIENLILRQTFFPWNIINSSCLYILYAHRESISVNIVNYLVIGNEEVLKFMELVHIKLTRFLKKKHFHSMKLMRIVGLVKLGDIKLTRVKRNCEYKSEIKSISSVFFCIFTVSLKSIKRFESIIVSSTVYLTAFRPFKIV